MTRASYQRIVRRPAASYYEHAARLQAADCVIYGPHLDVNPDDPEALRDPFRMARRFAHALALETGEPFSWGWYDSPEGLRPAACAADTARKFLRIAGTT